MGKFLRRELGENGVVAAVVTETYALEDSVEDLAEFGAGPGWTSKILERGNVIIGMPGARPMVFRAETIRQLNTLMSESGVF